MNSIHSSHLFSSTEMIDEEFRIDEQFSEFWNRDNEGKSSEEDISDFDGE